jgi:hypothetical protein
LYVLTHHFLFSGDNVMHDGAPWPAVGHGSPQGSPTFNPFGLAFQAAGLTWTVDLCQLDSDGDGRTNGEELGDPDCVWQPGTIPTRTTAITHPGFETLFDQQEEEQTASPQGDANVAVEPLSLPTWLTVHIVCMMLSWGLVLPVGALMAISFRGLLQTNVMWFKLHIALQLTGVALSIAGFVVAFTNIASHFKDTHQIMGTVVFAGGLYQAAQGFVRPHRPAKGETATTIRKVWEICHKGFGRIVIILAWVNIFLGAKLVKRFFEGVPENLTSTIFAGMNAVLGVQAALCFVLTVVSIFYRTTPKEEDTNSEGSGAMKNTLRNEDLEDQGSA